MQTAQPIETDRYARCIHASKRVRWDIDKDVIRGRRFDLKQRFLPDKLSKVDQFDFLSEDEKRLLSQIQGRTYANIFGLVERYINCKILEVSHDHWLGDQMALEALIRFSDEELKHQELFRRIEALTAEQMPEGYTFLPDPNDVAKAVLSKSTWSVLALTCHIELFTQVHYRDSIEPQADLSPLFKDVFLYHWQEESQHAILDELEWRRAHHKLTPGQVDDAVNDLIDLVAAVDGVLQMQAAADVDYFLKLCAGSRYEEQVTQLKSGVLAAYRWQYIVSGVQLARFRKILGSMITAEQFERISAALAPLMPH